MKAADTNVVLRIITEDDEQQAALARAAMRNATLYVSLTVAIEVEWVLRSAYRWDRIRIANAMVILTELEGLHVEDALLVRWAAARLRKGADFADMIHLVAVRNLPAFVTFDRKLEQAAGSETPLPVETLIVS
ncbi:MAG TPA: type II toxin-antitoxin system VapC family toxin [Sphingomonas sp.]|uniref:type II toxin-antitoxin system VapC family toxin n=1 Tax=Sphingomonas sp. TaxID=28214 RepID=UPI002ED8040C